jgi:sugar-specific transcriptional regulator TrmB
MNILRQLNLTENEALIYEILLQNGAQKASQIQKETPLKRGLVYKILENLEKKGLVIREDGEEKISTFTPIHPNVLKGLAEQQVKQAQEAQNSLQDELGSLVSMYNLANNKPGVEFYEGLEGLEKILADSLTSKTEIYTYSDLYHADKQTKKITDQYLQKRLRANISKKIITPISNKNLFSKTNHPLTKVKFLNNKILPFKTALQIYDNKISYQTLGKDNIISVLINDINIYSLHRGFFKAIWENISKSTL